MEAAIQTKDSSAALTGRERTQEVLRPIPAHPPSLQNHTAFVLI